MNKPEKVSAYSKRPSLPVLAPASSDFRMPGNTTSIPAPLGNLHLILIRLTQNYSQKLTLIPTLRRELILLNPKSAKGRVQLLGEKASREATSWLL